MFEILTCHGTIQCKHVIHEGMFIFFFIYVDSCTVGKSKVWPVKGRLIHHLSVSMSWMP